MKIQISVCAALHIPEALVGAVMLYQRKSNNKAARKTIQSYLHLTVNNGQLARLHPGTTTVYRIGDVHKGAVSFSLKKSGSARFTYTGTVNDMLVLRLTKTDPALDIERLFKICGERSYTPVEHEVIVDTSNLSASRFSVVEFIRKPPKGVSSELTHVASKILL